MAHSPSRSGSDTWQKNYYRGVDADNRPAVADHSTKLRLKAFADLETRSKS